MASPPPYPPDARWYGRYWRYTNRPRAGCGCLYLLIVFFVVWWIVSLLFPPLGWRYWWDRPVSELQQPAVHSHSLVAHSPFERLIDSI
jgi:hypothetical protein